MHPPLDARIRQNTNRIHKAQLLLAEVVAEYPNEQIVHKGVFARSVAQVTAPPRPRRRCRPGERKFEFGRVFTSPLIAFYFL